MATPSSTSCLDRRFSIFRIASGIKPSMPKANAGFKTAGVGVNHTLHIFLPNAKQENTSKNCHVTEWGHCGGRGGIQCAVFPSSDSLLMFRVHTNIPPGAVLCMGCVILCECVVCVEPSTKSSVLLSHPVPSPFVPTRGRPTYVNGACLARW